MSDAGYVHIYRSLMGHPAFRNDAEAMAFAWMVLRAAWRPIRVRYKDRVIELARGQFAVSVRDMANALDRDKAWVERLWKRLKSETMIETQSETGVSLVTIRNYDEFQPNADSGETPRKTPAKTRARQAQDTEQRREKGKKEEEGLEAKASCPTPVGPEPDLLPEEAGEEEGPDAPDSPSLRPEHVVDEWNHYAPRLGKPKVRDLTPERRQLLKSRIGQYALEDFQSVFGKIERSAFLRGDTGWRGCTFDWVFKKANFQKIIEGNYDQ